MYLSNCYILIERYNNNNGNNADLLGLSTPPSNQNSHQNALIDVLGDIYNNSNSSVHNNAKK